MDRGEGRENDRQLVARIMARARNPAPDAAPSRTDAAPRPEFDTSGIQGESAVYSEFEGLLRVQIRERFERRVDEKRDK